MKTIWKYTLETADEQMIDVPIGAKILCVQSQHDQPRLWIEVNSEETEKEVRTIYTYGTGHKISNDTGSYIGTYQLRQGTLVFHCFEKGN